MARYSVVTDRQDDRLAPYVALRDPVLRKAQMVPGPSGHGVFIAEGKLVLPRVLRSPYPIVSVLVSPARYSEFAPILDEFDIDVLVCDQAIMDLTTGYHLHRGLLVCAGRLPLTCVEDVARNARRVAIVEGISDQENLGSIFRSASALGIDGVLLDLQTCDPLYRRVVRVSMGHCLYVPWARVEPWPDALGTLTHHGFELVALTPAAHAVPLREFASRDRASAGGAASANAPAKLALAFGAESDGLSPEFFARAHHHVRIEQQADVDSLNVSHAAAIVFAALGNPTNDRSNTSGMIQP